MDNQLLSIIHKFAEDREIGYMEAKNVGETYGMKFENEDQLREFKQKIDRYLGTFKQKDFNAIEEACKRKKSKKKSNVNEAVSTPRQKTVSAHDKSEKAQRFEKTSKSKDKMKSLYTKAQVERLKKHYNVDSADKALSRAIRDKQKGIDPLSSKKTNPKMNTSKDGKAELRKRNESRKRRKNNLEEMLNVDK